MSPETFNEAKRLDREITKLERALDEVTTFSGRFNRESASSSLVLRLGHESDGQWTARGRLPMSFEIADEMPAALKLIADSLCTKIDTAQKALADL